MAQAPKVMHGDRKFNGFVDFDKNEARNLRLHQLAADPGTPVDGQTYYHTGINKVRIRANGSWTELATMADVTANGISAAIMDAKGDLIVATGADAAQRKAVGANGTALFADSAQADGLIWRGVAISDVSGLQAALDGKADDAEITGLDGRLDTAEATLSGLGSLATKNTVTTADITADAVTFAKVEDIATNTILGRVTAGTGDIEELNAAQIRTLINVENGATGDMTKAEIDALGINATQLGGQAGSYYLNRVNHTGDIPVANVTGLEEVVEDYIGGALTDSATLDVTYDDTAGTYTFAVLNSPTVGGFTPAQLRDRSTHTGAQTASTISDFAEAVSDQLGTMVTGNTETGITVTYDDADNTLDFAVTDSPLLGGQNGAYYLSRANHTGAQAISTITGLQTALDAKVNTTALGAANGVATLGADSKIPSNQLPALALTDVSVVADITARNALTVQEGDVAIVTGTNQTFIYDGTTWQLMESPTDGVTAVTGGTGITSSGGTTPEISITNGSIGDTQLATNAVNLAGTKVTGTLPATKGGTGQSTYAVGDLLIGGATNTLTKLAAAATGNALISAGAGAAPTWGKITLTTHVSGTLPIANGGTGGATAAAARTALGTGGAAAGVLTGGTNSFVINHPLNTRDIAKVTLVNTVAPYDAIDDFYWEATTTGTITVYAGSGYTLPTGYRWVVLSV